MTDGLVRFGYTEREATFLQLASLLSGYFLRRHFNEFIQKESGAIAQRFIQRGLALGHFKVLSALGGRKVYHLAGSQIYGTLGEEDNRNRREHRPETVRRRLMALDFALSERGASWLLTEGEKLQYFNNLGLNQDDLPNVVFAGKSKRFFVDKQPIFVADLDHPSFAFVDEGFRTLSQWEIFLRGHRTLLHRLEKATVVFASSQPVRFASAEVILRKTVAGETSSGGVDVDRLRTFFASRKLFEGRRFESFDQNRLDALRENQRVFAGPEFERLYNLWRQNGDLVLVGLRPNRVAFRTVILPHFYEWLSPIQTFERRA